MKKCICGTHTQSNHGWRDTGGYQQRSGVELPWCWPCDALCDWPYLSSRVYA